MGFFDRLKAVFTRKASTNAKERRGLLSRSRSASARKATATRAARGASKFGRAAEASAQRKRSEAWKADRAKQMARDQAKANAEFAKGMNAADKEAARIRAGEARAAATRKARENKVAAELLKAPKANAFEELFRQSLQRLKTGKNQPGLPYRAQGSVRPTEKLRSASKKSKSRSAKVRAGNWDPFAPDVKSKTKSKSVNLIQFPSRGKNKTPNLIQFPSKAKSYNPFD